MQSFIHKYAKFVRLRFSRGSAGGLVGNTLIVTANISLEPSSLGYDRQKVDELETAVVAYAEKHYASLLIEFEED